MLELGTWIDRINESRLKEWDKGKEEEKKYSEKAEEELIKETY